MWIICVFRFIGLGVYCAMPVKIYSTDTAREIAEKIFNQFVPGDMVQIFGWVKMEKTETLMPKGEAVLEVLRWLYENKHYGHNGRAREYKYKLNAIGGAIAHPIWTWERRIIDGEPRFMIWRVQ